MRFPEFKDNKAFQFVAKGLLAIELLEEQCVGKTYDELISYIDNIIKNAEPEDEELYQAIKKAYSETDRKQYLECKKLDMRQSKTQQTEKEPEL